MSGNVGFAHLIKVNENFAFVSLTKLNFFKLGDYRTGLYLLTLKHLST